MKNSTMLLSILVLASTGILSNCGQRKTSVPAAEEVQINVTPIAGGQSQGSATTLGEMKIAAGSHTSYSQNMYAPGVGHDCGENKCNGFGQNGCATCVVLEAYLPLTATITDIRCMTTANYPGDSPIHKVNCTTDNAWSIFDAPTTSKTEWAQVVRTIYHNRSGDRTRVVHLEVDWQ